MRPTRKKRIGAAVLCVVFSSFSVHAGNMFYPVDMSTVTIGQGFDNTLARNTVNPTQGGWCYDRTQKALINKDNKNDCENAPGNPVWLYGHMAIDLAAPCGTEIKAMADGVVQKLLTDGNLLGVQWGNAIMIRHNDVLPDARYVYSIYPHLQVASSLREGDPVTAGKTTLGFVGATGTFSTGCHVHWGVLIEWKNGDSHDFRA